MYNRIKNILRIIFSITVLIGMSSMNAPAQLGNYPNPNSRGYGSSFGGGGGFSNQFGGSYGGSYGGGGGGIRGQSSIGRGSIGGSAFGSRGGVSGGIGNSRFGGRSSRSSSGGFGTSQYGRGGIGTQQFDNSGNSSRGRSSRGRSNFSNRGFGNTGNEGFSSRGNSSRYQRYGSNQQSDLQGQSPTSQGGDQSTGQTSPTGTSSERRGALSGRSSRGALSPSGGTGGDSSGMIQIQGGKGGGNQQAARRGQPNRRGGSSSPSQPSVSVKQSATLYLKTDGSIKLLNEPFPVDVKLSNARDTAYDKIQFALRYDPSVVMPMRFTKPEEEESPIGWEPAGKLYLEDTYLQASSEESTPPTEMKKGDDPHTSFIAAKSSQYEITKNEIDEENGLIQFSADVVSKSSEDDGLVARLYFLPVKESDNSNLSFVYTAPQIQSQGYLTALTLNGDDQLGSKYDSTDGSTGLNLRIYETLERAKRDPRVYAENESKFQEEGEGRDFGTHIYILPRQKQLDVGDIVEVDVYLANPNQETIDTVNLLVAYNPRVFQAIDTDEMEPGININDEAYKTSFPFDFPVMNTVKEEKGLIDFRKQGYKVPVSSEGVFATFRLRAVRPTKKTTFRVFLSEQGTPPTTGVFYRNQDRLGDPSDPFDGVTTASIEVRPTTAYLEKVRYNRGEG